MEKPTQAIIPTLNHQLSLLIAPRHRGWGLKFPQDEDSWSDTDSSISESDRSSTGSLSATIIEPEESTSNEEPSLEKEKIDDKVATVLDHLKDGGIHLTQLAIDFDSDRQWVREQIQFQG